MALVSQKLSEGLPHVWFEPDILTLETVNELWILPASVAAQMGEVDIHGSLLLYFELLSNLDVVLDQLNCATTINTAVQIDVVGIHLIVRILGTQREAENN